MAEDPKRQQWLWGLAIPAVANVALLGYQFGPKFTRKLCAATGLLTLHLALPWLDRHLGEDTNNPDEATVARLEQDPYYLHIVKAYIPLQYSANVYAAYLASRVQTSTLDRVLLGTLLGVVNAVAMNVAHELGHKKDKKQHLWAHLALLPSLYSHFRIEHNYGHHRHVATPLDSASARLGESFWRYLPRTVQGGFCSAIKIEQQRLTRRGERFFSVQNELLQAWSAALAYQMLSWGVLGHRGFVMQGVQSAYAITILEAVNYMEHYGLKRTQYADGSYQRIAPEHSWNNNNRFSNLLFYQLQRHSDHHAYPQRGFQALRHYEHVPQLPAGYGALLHEVFIPQRWFALMDARVLRYYQGDLNRVHIEATTRDHIQQRYAVLIAQLKTQQQQTAV